MRWLKCLLPMAVLVSCLALGCGQSGKTTPKPQSLEGLSKQEIVSRMGKPSGDFEGHYGGVTQEYADKYPNVRTYVFEFTDSTVYVTINLDTGICISAFSLDPGGKF